MLFNLGGCGGCQTMNEGKKERKKECGKEVENISDLGICMLWLCDNVKQWFNHIQHKRELS